MYRATHVPDCVYVAFFAPALQGLWRALYHAPFLHYTRVHVHTYIYVNLHLSPQPPPYYYAMRGWLTGSLAVHYW